MAVSKRLRFEIIRRDGFACRYCGAKAPAATLTVDHVTPVALGGRDEPENLVAACSSCNWGKTSTAPEAEHAADTAERHAAWASATSEALAQIVSEDLAIEASIDGFDDIWNSWTYGTPTGERKRFPRPSSWRGSIRTMLAAGASMEILDYAVKIAIESDARDEWAYFCGVVWRTLDRAQEIAAATNEPGETPDEEN